MTEPTEPQIRRRGKARKRRVPLGIVLSMRRRGVPIAVIAKKLNIHVATVYRRLDEERQKALKEDAEREYLEDVPDPSEKFQVLIVREYGGGEVGNVLDHTATNGIINADRRLAS